MSFPVQWRNVPKGVMHVHSCCYGCSSVNAVVAFSSSLPKFPSIKRLLHFEKSRINLLLFDFFQFYQPYKSFTRDEIKSLLQDTVRTIWWYIFLEIYLHFFYSTAITLDPRIFSSLSNWAIAGIMYSQLNIFLVKYKVFYIGAGVFARIDGVSAPLPPRCVTTLYLFSDMWK